MAYSDLNNTAKVRFLAGTQASIATLISNGDAIEGAFYLTNDTHRLYVGRQVSGSTDVIPVPVNEGINFVTSVPDLPTPATSAEKVDTAGHFYYASSENVLCVYNGKNWVQINPDTNDDHAVYGTNINFTKVTSENASTLSIPYSSTAIQYQVTIPLSRYDLKNTSAQPSAAGTAVGTLAINAADVAQIATQHSVGVSGTFDNSNQTITLQTNGAGSDGGTTSVVLSAGNNISFAQANASDPITISTPSIYVGASGNKIGLKQGNAGNWTNSYGSVEISATNELSAATDVNGETITISHETQSGLTASTYGGITQSATTGNYSTKTVNIPSLSVNSYGHITSATTNSYTLQEITGITVDGTTINLYANGNTGAPVASAAITAFGDYVTTSDFNTALQGLNAMTYRGTVSGSLPNSDVHRGDTYLVNGAITGSSEEYKIGDMLIATGDEVNGVIPAASISWTRVQTDYNTDTQYTFDADASNKTFTFRSTASGGNLSNYTTFAFSTNSLNISVATSSDPGNNIYHNTLTFDMAWGTF